MGQCVLHLIALRGQRGCRLSARVQRQGVGLKGRGLQTLAQVVAGLGDQALGLSPVKVGASVLASRVGHRCAHALGGPNWRSGLGARSYSGSTRGIRASISRMRESPEGWVLSHCGGEPLLAASIFCHSVTPDFGL